MTCICIDIIFFYSKISIIWTWQKINRNDVILMVWSCSDSIRWSFDQIMVPSKKAGSLFLFCKKNRALTFKDDIKYGKGKREFVLKIMKHKEWIHISCDVGLCVRKRLGYFQNLSSPPLLNFTLPGLDKVRQGLVLIAAPASMGVELRRQAFEVT